MHPALVALAAVPWREIVTAVPRVMETAVDVYDSVRGQRRPRPGRIAAGPNDLGALRGDLVKLEERVDSLEGRSEVQAELIAQMTRHDAALLRWLIVLTLVLFVTVAVAAVAIVFAILW